MRAISYIIALGSQAAFVVLLAGCPKNNDATTTTDGASASSAAPPASQVTLAPLGDTATAATSVAPPTVTATGTTTGVAIKPTTSETTVTSATATTPANANTQAQLKQCCSALRKQAKAQPAQAGQLTQAAGICDGLVAAMGTAPVVPQLDQMKLMTQGIALPPVCQGL